MLTTIASLSQTTKVKTFNKWDKYDNLYDDTTHYTKYKLLIKTDSPGKCLIGSSRSTIGGLVFMGIGSGILTYSLSFSDSYEKTPLQVVGCAVALTGIILQIRGIILIGKAGRLMEKEYKKTLTYNVSLNKVGLAVNF